MRLTVQQVQAVKEAVEFLKREHARATGVLNQMAQALGSKSLKEAREKLDEVRVEVERLEAEYERKDGPFWADYQAATGQERPG